MSKSVIKNIAKKVVENPFEWVLVIGDISWGGSVALKRKKIIKLAKKYKEIFSDSKDFYDNIINEDYKKISDMIFGNVWDKISFLNSIKESQKKIREEYANSFDKKNWANIETVDIKIEKVLQAFPGIIMTIHQDELLEAFWESRRSMSADERIWTPYQFSTSTTWNKWEIFKEELISLSLSPMNFQNSEPHLLVKLYGSCSEPMEMLLSSEDFETYYPKLEAETYAKKFLMDIFKTKNIIFWGADTDCINNDSEPFVPGISSLLETAPEQDFERYIFIKGQPKNVDWEKYHMSKISLPGDKDSMYYLLDKIIDRQKKYWTAIRKMLCIKILWEIIRELMVNPMKIFKSCFGNYILDGYVIIYQIMKRLL